MCFEKIVSEKGCYVIGEAGLNHNGSLEMAKLLIDVAVIAGADAVKFQKRTVDRLAVKKTLEAADDRFPQFGATYKEIRQYLEFDAEQYRELKRYASERHIDFIVTAFDTEAVDFLDELGVDVIKLASHSVTNIELLNYLSERKKPTIMSTGMADLDEIATAVDIFCKNNSPLMLLHCVSSYPTPLDQCNLEAMTTLRSKFDLPVGYSGHELGYLPTLTAVAMGAVAVERHYTLSNELPGFDHKMSLESDDFISMVKQIRLIQKIKGDGSKSVSDNEMVTRNKYHVSIASACRIPMGAVITKDMIRYRNPGTGIPAKQEAILLGKKAVVDIDEDVLIKLEMVH